MPSVIGAGASGVMDGARVVAVAAVAVLGLRAQELAGQVGHGDLPLRAGLEVAQLDVARSPARRRR